MTKHILEPLPYAYDALEPYIDARTMELHHDKHHQTYVDKLNSALESHPHLGEKSLEDLLRSWQRLPAGIRDAVRDHGGGHFNHRFFWATLAKDVPWRGEIVGALEKSFGGADAFLAAFKQAAVSLFGSGWAWLVMNGGDELEIVSTRNQESPISQGLTPLLGVDVWEHAYYLKYQNRRAECLDAFFHVIDWEKVNNLYVSARRQALAAK